MEEYEDFELDEEPLTAKEKATMTDEEMAEWEALDAECDAKVEIDSAIESFADMLGREAV